MAAKKFQDAVDKARKILGIKSLHKVDSKEINKWVEDNIKPVPSLTIPDLSAKEQSLRHFYSVINLAMEEAALPKTWRNYLAYFVITNMPPNETEISAKRKIIEVKNIDEDTITIRIAKGVRYEEYTKSWTALSEYLGKGRRKTKLPDEQTRLRDLQMYGKRQHGVTQRELAKEYFSTDIEYSKDAVKKALRRQKKLFDEGTDLAK